MKFALLALLLVTANAFAETLRFEKFNVTAETAWNVLPSTAKETIMTIEFLDERGETIEPNASLNVELFMPQMGHGSGPTALERVMDNAGEPIPGTYRVKNMWFIMKGFWEVRVKLKKGSLAETQTLKVNL